MTVIGKCFTFPAKNRDRLVCLQGNSLQALDRIYFGGSDEFKRWEKYLVKKYNISSLYLILKKAIQALEVTGDKNSCSILITDSQITELLTAEQLYKEMHSGTLEMRKTKLFDAIIQYAIFNSL